MDLLLSKHLPYYRQVVALVLCASLVLPATAEPFATRASEQTTSLHSFFISSKNCDLSIFHTQALSESGVLFHDILVWTHTLFFQWTPVRDHARHEDSQPTFFEWLSTLLGGAAHHTLITPEGISLPVSLMQNGSHGDRNFPPAPPSTADVLNQINALYATYGIPRTDVEDTFDFHDADPRQMARENIRLGDSGHALFDFINDWLDHSRFDISQNNALITDINAILTQMDQLGSGIATALPTAHEWLAYGVTWGTKQARFENRARQLARLSPRGSVFLLGLMGAHMRRSYDRDDIPVYCILLAGVLPELQRQIRNLREKNWQPAGDLKQTQEFIHTLLGSLCIGVKPTVYDGFLREIQRALLQENEIDLFSVLQELADVPGIDWNSTTAPSAYHFWEEYMGHEDIANVVVFNGLRGRRFSARSLFHTDTDGEELREAILGASKHEAAYVNQNYRTLTAIIRAGGERTPGSSTDIVKSNAIWRLLMTGNWNEFREVLRVLFRRQTPITSIQQQELIEVNPGLSFEAAGWWDGGEYQRDSGNRIVLNNRYSYEQVLKILVHEKEEQRLEEGRRKEEDRYRWVPPIVRGLIGELWVTRHEKHLSDNSPGEFLLRALGIRWQIYYNPKAAEAWDVIPIEINPESEEAYATFFGVQSVGAETQTTLILENNVPKAIFWNGRLRLLDDGRAEDPVLWNALLNRESTAPLEIKRAYRTMHIPLPGFSKPLIVFDGVYPPLYEFAEGQAMSSSFALLQNFPDVHAQDILDAGAGNGIAGIYALLRGARKVVAFDSNPIAVWNARYNAWALGISEAYEIQQRDPNEAGLPAIEGNYDAIFCTPPIQSRSTKEGSSSYQSNYEDENGNLLHNVVDHTAASLKSEGRLFLSYARDDHGLMTANRAADAELWLEQVRNSINRDFYILYVYKKGGIHARSFQKCIAAITPTRFSPSPR